MKSVWGIEYQRVVVAYSSVGGSNVSADFRPRKSCERAATLSHYSRFQHLEGRSNNNKFYYIRPAASIVEFSENSRLRPAADGVRKESNLKTEGAHSYYVCIQDIC
jgi:hypothetical protein